MAYHSAGVSGGEVQLGNFYFSDGDVHTVEEGSQANVDVITMPTQPASSTLLFDIEGVGNTITLIGALTIASSARVSNESYSPATADVTSIEAQKTYLKALLNGAQSPLKFVSTYNSSGIYVMVQSVKFTENVGDPNRLQFQISIVEGTS